MKLREIKDENINISKKFGEKGFYTSDDTMFSEAVTMINQFIQGKKDNIKTNDMLIIFRDGKILIYEDFPVQMESVLKITESAKFGDTVMTPELIDIKTLYFTSSRDKIFLQENDKFIWFFRNKWNFGLYFDFTGSVDKETINRELASKFRYLEFINIYKNITDAFDIEHLINEGWFPFIDLIRNKRLSILRKYFEYEGEKREKLINSFINDYDRIKISAMVEDWLKIPEFKEKEKEIKTAVDAYLFGDTESALNMLSGLTDKFENINEENYKIYRKKYPLALPKPFFNFMINREKDGNSEHKKRVVCLQNMLILDMLAWLK